MKSGGYPIRGDVQRCGLLAVAVQVLGELVWVNRL